MGGVAGIAYITAQRQYAAGTPPIPRYRLGSYTLRHTIMKTDLAGWVRWSGL